MVVTKCLLTIIIHYISGGDTYLNFSFIGLYLHKYWMDLLVDCIQIFCIFFFLWMYYHVKLDTLCTEILHIFNNICGGHQTFFGCAPNIIGCTKHYFAAHRTLSQKVQGQQFLIFNCFINHNFLNILTCLGYIMHIT